MKYFTFRWSKFGKRKNNNTISVKIKVLDDTGKSYVIKKEYREWIGVATNDIKRVVKEIKRNFRTCRVSYQLASDRPHKEILPLLYDRLKRNCLLDGGEEDKKSFYKVYVDACTYDVGDFLNCDHVSYYAEEDWLTRVYIDLRSKFRSEKFYYCWYEIDPDERDLVASFRTVYEQDNTLPPMRIGSYDLETVPWEIGSTRFPSGHDRNDVIVMASLVIGDVLPSGKIDIGRKSIFYLNPLKEELRFESGTSGDVEYLPYFQEIHLLHDFLTALNEADVSVITGYNINNYDFPCLFARLAFLGSSRDLSLFTSATLGKYLVTTFRKKYVVDMYTYTINFSPAGLPSFKLDDVAKTRVKDSKVEIRATGIHKYYQKRDTLTAEILQSDDLERCYEFVRPGFSMCTFGTFRTCLDYCVKDSVLVLKLMEHENALSFLIARANIAPMSLEQVLYVGNSKYIQRVLESYGTMLGYFVNLERLRNVDEDDGEPFLSHATTGKIKRYQGALNYCEEQSFCRNVAVYDFESLYPSTIICRNISYETFAVVRAETFDKLDDAIKARCDCVPFRIHGQADFVQQQQQSCGERYEFPGDPQPLVMVSLKETTGFLPTVLEHFVAKRRREKFLMSTASKNNYLYHKNRQTSYKLIMNSLYGCLGSNDSVLSNFGLGMSVTCFARNILLGSFHYLRSRGKRVPYCDTDSLFVVDDDGGGALLHEEINSYLNLKSINLQHEKTYSTMLILMKKKYCYELNGIVRSKGFEVKSNPLTKHMVSTALRKTFEALENDAPADPSTGWCLLVDLLTRAYFTSRRPSANCMTRKVKALEDYSPNCTAPHVRLMRRQQQGSSSSRTVGNFINFTYVFTDISEEGSKRVNPMFAEDVDEEDHRINFEKLYVSQKTNILKLLNVGFFKYPFLKPLYRQYNELIQTMRWKQVVNSAILCRHFLKEEPMILVERARKYDFKIVHEKFNRQ